MEEMYAIQEQDVKVYRFKFTCIMAVYKVEEYIEEAIESVLNQDIGFKENVQLILVDDGTPDDAGIICDKFANKFPENIKVIHKENHGLSSAKNAGLKYATGEFVNFIDSDDKFTLSTLRHVYDFFSRVTDKVDIVSIPVRYFEGAKGDHHFNDKFKKGARIINLNIDYNFVQLFSNSAFYRSETILQLRFDENVFTSEDFRLNYEIFLNKPFLGVVPKGCYLYRKRISSNGSLLQVRWHRKESYIPYLDLISNYLISLYKNKLGYVPLFLQKAIIFDFNWFLKIKEIPCNTLTEQEFEEFLEKSKNMLHHIEDNLIMSQRNLYKEIKIQALFLKYNCFPKVDIRNNDILIYFKDLYINWLSNLPTQIHIIQERNNTLEVYGKSFVYTFLEAHMKNISLKIGEVEYPCEIINTTDTTLSLGISTMKLLWFGVKIPINSINVTEQANLNIVHYYNDNPIIKSNFSFKGRRCFSTRYKEYYLHIGDFIMKFDKKKNFSLRKSTEKELWAQEKRFIVELLQSDKKSDNKAALVRILLRIAKLKKRKQLWLLSDRINKADDNAESLFKFLKQKESKIKKSNIFFSINSDSEDYNKMKRFGKVVKHNSFLYKFIHLYSDVIISSQADDYVVNPFGKYDEPFRDILSKKHFIFLQHGITKDNLSNWLCKYEKNISGFVTAAHEEYNSILENNYFYDEENIWLTGLPRFDREIGSERKSIITIMPTWRRYLTKNVNIGTGKRDLHDEFKKSSYYIFYNSLINHTKLLEACDRMGFQVVFHPHPNIIPHINTFSKNENVKFNSVHTRYEDVYLESAFILTDYSSVVFDFSYLRKPIIYAHFDKDEFFSGEHVYTQGYFDYERDGFGEVEYDLESTVNRIIEYMENGCQLKDKYRERIDNFFAFNDQNNCERVYNAIMELDKEE